MIKSLHLTNFKGIREHTIVFRDFSVVVGHNNAGKLRRSRRCESSLRLQRGFYPQVRQHSFLGRRFFETGISPTLDEVKLKPETVFFKDSEPPVVIKAMFQNETEIADSVGNDLVNIAAKISSNEIVEHDASDEQN